VLAPTRPFPGRQSSVRNIPEGLAKAFYATVALATLIGALINFSPINPIKALYWSAVLNGIVAVPVMAMMMLISVNPKIMGKFTIGGAMRVMGWTATAVMGVAVLAMAITSIV
jgi:Mn2+/Fe2+ NRAMP family transporter